MAEQYVYQVNPTAPVVKFSDRPVKIGGVKVQPRWAWSADYKRLANSAVRHTDNEDLRRKRAENYAQWWVDNHWGRAGQVVTPIYDLPGKLTVYQEGHGECPCKGGTLCPHYKSDNEELAA